MSLFCCVGVSNISWQGSMSLEFGQHDTSKGAFFSVHVTVILPDCLGLVIFMVGQEVIFGRQLAGQVDDLFTCGSFYFQYLIGDTGSL